MHVKMRINVDKLKKIHRTAWLAGGAWLIIGAIVFIGYPWYQAIKSFQDFSYNYKIKEIEFRPGHRGVPHLKVDSVWYFPRSNEELQLIHYIHVGDSMVKEKGSLKIKVYRDNGDGGLTVKEFD
jgi:hypothetical protein